MYISIDSYIIKYNNKKTKKIKILSKNETSENILTEGK